MTSLFKINSKLLFLITITFLISMTLAVLGKEEAVSWVNLNNESPIMRHNIYYTNINADRSVYSNPST